MNCPFCKIKENLDREAICYENELVLAFMDIRQINIGEVLVIPKRHVENIFELSEQELIAISKVVRLISNAVRKGFNPDGIMIYNLSGRTQEIPHLHFHIIPRYKNDKYSEVTAKVISKEESLKFLSVIEDRRKYAQKIITLSQSTAYQLETKPQITGKMDKKEIEKKLGRKFLVWFLTLLDGMNRLNSLLDFLILNDQIDKSRTTVRWTRNFLNGISLSMGVVWEIYIRIKEVKTGDISQKNKLTRRKIDELLSLFSNPGLLQLLKAFRNQLSFHIDICNTELGIDMIKEPFVDFVKVDSNGRRIDGIYPFAYESTINGFVERNKKDFLQFLGINNTHQNMDEGLIEKALLYLFESLKEIHFGLMKKIEEEFIPLIIQESNLEITD